MPYTATVSVSSVKSATPVGDDFLLGSLESNNKTRLFRVSDVVALASGGVSEVNGATGVVSLTSIDVSAASAVHSHVAADISDFATEAALYGPVASVNGLTGAVSLIASDVTAVASVNGLSGAITIAAGDNVTVTTAGSSITIAAGGGGGGAVDSVNGQTGTVVLSAVDVTAADALHASQHQTGGGDEVLPVVAAVALTASVNDYALPTGDIFRLANTSATGTVNITGLATAADGEAKLLVNVSTHTSCSYTLKHADTNSTAASRFLVPWEGDYVLSPKGGAALVIYDDTDERWRVV